ncbi:hypothetical protein PENSPDRAFT_650972 [Peniophora sp. CONT]|nr:hypothetical protein PENSPDRAFT_650972 [Peniophora sp. CONT]
MAPSPQCAALNAAFQRKGMSYGQIASRLGTNEQHVIDVCTGAKQPTQAEFEGLARVLDITGPVPQSPAHQTKF